MWHLTMNNSLLTVGMETVLFLDREEVETRVATCQYYPITHRIPSGFFIKSMGFLNADDVLISRISWQNISGLGLGKMFLIYFSGFKRNHN